jgi:tripartite-type tricarboxylate transporter receptor subunit TctC
MITKILSLLATAMAVMAMVAPSVFANTVEYKYFVQAAPGAGPDQVARKISQLVKDQSGINLVIFNITGGNGLLGVMDFKKEKLAVIGASTSQLVYLPIQLTEAPYQLTDFNIIAPMGIGGTVVFTRENSPIKTLNDLVKILPTLKNGSVGVAAADAAANARALVQLKNLNVPVANFKSHTEVATAVVGGHVEVGMVPIATDLVWHQAEAGKLQILGTVSNGPFVRDGKTYPSVNQTFNLPAFYSGVWLAMTPGDTKEHQDLKKALLMAHKDQELQTLAKRVWPLSNTITLESIINTANRHRDLLK